MKMSRHLFSCIAISLFAGCGDDLQHPAPPECTTNTDCARAEQCLAGYCVPPMQSCVLSSDCSAYNKFSCIAVTCNAGTCAYENVCQCNVDSDCPGWSAYTCLAVACVAKSCVARNSCSCNSTKDCDDGNACTEDVCTRNGSQQTCIHLAKMSCGGTDAGTPSDLANVIPDLASTSDLASAPDLATSPDLAQVPACNDPADCNDGDPCTADFCEVNGGVLVCRHVAQACPPDGGAADAASPADLTIAVDLARPNDLSAPFDLAVPSDLAPPADLALISANCKWTYNIETDAGVALFSSISMAMKINGGPMDELCRTNFASSSIMCSKMGMQKGDQMDVSIEYVLDGEPGWSCFGHGAQGTQYGILTCTFSHTQAVVSNWTPVTNGGVGPAEGCNLRAFVP